MRVRRRRSTGARARALLALVLLALAVILFNQQIRPVMESVTVNRAKARSIEIINSVVLNEIDQNGLSYENLVNINRDADGRVLSITSDITKMNRVKANIIADVQKGLDGMEESGEDIPIGTLIGSHLFHGYGPSLRLRITLTGNVKADFKSTFESTGINQTRHRIFLSVDTSVYSFLPGVSETTDVSTDVLVAETVIVGEVPEVLVNSK